MGNNEPRCLYAKWQNMSWWRTWLISKSHSASTRGPLSCGRGKKGFHKISPANQQAGNDGHACGWAGALPAETNPDIMLLPVSERGYKKTTSMSLAEIWHQKYSRSNPKLYIIWEWRSLPFSEFYLEHPWQTNDALLDREIALFMDSKLLTATGTACFWLPLLTIQF